MKLSKKGVSLYELLAYTTILGFVTVILFTLVNLSMSHVARLQQANQMYVYANTILTDIKHESEDINNTDSDLIVTDYSTNRSQYIEITDISDPNTTYLSITLTNSTGTLVVDSSSGGVTSFHNNSFTFNYDESSILIDRDSCTTQPCSSAIININLSINYNNARYKELFTISIAI